MRPSGTMSYPPPYSSSQLGYVQFYVTHFKHIADDREYKGVCIIDCLASRFDGGEEKTGEAEEQTTRALSSM